MRVGRGFGEESYGHKKSLGMNRGFQIWLRDQDSTAQQNALQRGPEGVRPLGRITWDVVPGESPMATKKPRYEPRL